MSEKTTFARWGGKLVYGGFLAFALSWLTAERLSGKLHEIYPKWLTWREDWNWLSEDPETITGLLDNLIWALVFICSWWMFWKLDSLLGFEPTPKEPADKQETRTEEPTEERKRAKDDKGKKSEEKEPDPPKESDEGQSGESDESFASVQPEAPSDPLEAGFAETLGLEVPYSEKEIKSAYRKLIAQYHPDRVSAMGPEIREVAETKAREINEAYEFFRKKFEQDQ